MTVGASQDQNFTTYIGDDAAPIFTVLDSNGVAIDISTVSDIIWNAGRTVSGTPAIAKTKSAGGGITFVTDGTNGQFTVAISRTDSAALSGNYQHQAILIDAGNERTTVSMGTMTVGRAPVWTYDATLLGGTDATAKLMQVRRLCGDVLSGDKQMFDEEINFALAMTGNVYRAAADCCRNISSQYARKVDIVEQDRRTAYSAQARNYQMRAAELDRIANIRGGGLPISGGISVVDKLSQVLNPDRVAPSFNRGMQDNYIPVSPAGNIVPSGADGGGGEIIP